MWIYQHRCNDFNLVKKFLIYKKKEMVNVIFWACNFQTHSKSSREMALHCEQIINNVVDRRFFFAWLQGREVNTEAWE